MRVFHSSPGGNADMMERVCRPISKNATTFIDLQLNTLAPDGRTKGDNFELTFCV
jgi:hypothetical protein